MNIPGELLWQVIAGSKAYGLDTPTSDTDIRGIFLQPNKYRLGFGYKEQVADNTNDVVYYELNRFCQLAAQNNPNIIEVLFAESGDVLMNQPRIEPLINRRQEFLSKRIAITFGGYAVSQIKKARGLNKKVVNPVPKKRKTPLDFCYIFEKEDGYMMLAQQWLNKHNFKQEHIGLSEMPNGVQLYKVYYDWVGESHNDNPRYKDMDTMERFRGIIKDGSDEIRHSQVPKNFPLQGFLYYNMDGYSSYCKDYKEYWEWVDKRNPHRYNDNQKHGKGYDGKNLMHCVRLLETAIDVAKYGDVILRRPNRDFLMSIRYGEQDYDEIMKIVSEREIEMKEAFEASTLPKDVDMDMVNDIILEIRSH